MYIMDIYIIDGDEDEYNNKQFQRSADLRANCFSNKVHDNFRSVKRSTKKYEQAGIRCLKEKMK
jgi:hypothetical protein